MRGIFSLNQRGQESAPFELLVAVVIMTFVIIMGTQALDMMARQKCMGEINESIQQLQFAIQDVTRGDPQTEVNFRLPGCFSGENEAVVISEKDEVEICSEWCPGSQAYCTLLIYVPDDLSVPQVWKCLRISPLTSFLTGDECRDPAGRELLEDMDYDLIDMKDPVGYGNKIPEGRYVFRAVYSTMDIPQICAYVKRR